ncbi:porin family protein [Flavobacterium sp. HNIBRBA15423]|uniref:porin family protein n=1 Tax=Flavobacterium sp. HNIBRBA15423 TaxID=3458683 RepID=UPI0040447CC4
MKKVLVFVAIATFGFLEKTSAQDIKFGLKTGLNIANITGSDADKNNLFGIHIGAISEIIVSDKFSVQPELLYSSQGSEIGNSFKIKLDYLTLPIMAKYYVMPKLSLELGPQVSFLLSDKIEFEGAGSTDAETDAASTDIGLNAGAGYKFDSGIFMQARYNFGITTISENPDIRNSVFQLSLGYQF